MSDDEADPELLELLRQRLGLSSAPTDEVSRDTGVLRDAEYVYNNAIDVLVDMRGTKAAAATIYQAMQDRNYSPETWQQHELHPKAREGFDQTNLANFVFLMDMLNYSFWSPLSEESRFQVEYRGKRWTGYNSLVACLRRALDEGIPITTPRFWRSRQCSNELLSHVFRSATSEEMPLLEVRMRMIREAGEILHERYGSIEDDDDAFEEELDELTSGVEMENGEIAEQSSTGPWTDKVIIDTTRVHDPVADEGLNGVQDHPGENGIAVDRHAVSTDTSGAEAHIAQPHVLGEALLDAKATPEVGRTPEANEEAHERQQPRAVPARLSPAANTIEDVIANIPARYRRPDLTIVQLIQEAKGSAGKLVNLLSKYFPMFHDVCRFEGHRVRFLKRAQILAADLWVAFACTDLGEFDDIGHMTMFADYRVPQILHMLGVLSFSPPLEYYIRDAKLLETGHSWEVQLRGCSIWAVELIRREILKQHPEAHINAVLMDFFLYDLAKEREAQGT